MDGTDIEMGLKETLQGFEALVTDHYIHEARAGPRRFSLIGALPMG